MSLCGDCGDEVIEVVADGYVTKMSRVMVPGPAGLTMAVHYCRNYIAWHEPPGPYDFWTLDLPADWQARTRAASVA